MRRADKGNQYAVDTALEVPWDAHEFHANTSLSLSRVSNSWRRSLRGVCGYCLARTLDAST